MKKRTIENSSLSVFFHDLSLLIASGLTPAEIAEMTSEDTPDPSLKAALAELYPRLSEGDSLSCAVRATEGFPDYCADMLESAEAAGRVEEVGAALSRYYDRKARTEALVKSALTRPLALLGLLCLVLAGFLFLVLPAISGVYDVLAGNAGLYVSGAYIIAGTALGALLLILLAALVLWALTRKGRCKGAVLRLWDKSSLTRDASLLLARSSFAADMDVQLSGGLLIEEAFARSAEHIRRPDFRETALRCTERVSEGESVGTVLRSERLMPPLATQRLFAALRGGRLEEAASKVNEELAEESRERTKRLIGCIEPILSGAFAILLGCSLLSVLLPLLGVIAGMGGIR